MKKALQFLTRRNTPSPLCIVTCILLIGMALAASHLANTIESKLDVLIADLELPR